MKKLIFFALTLILSLGLIACSNNPTQEEKLENLPEEPSPEVKIEEKNEELASTNIDQSLNETEIIDESIEAVEPSVSELQEISYEIVHTESDGNFPVLFVTVPDQNADQLKLIAQELKSEYPSSSFTGVNVVFFTEDYQQEAINHDSSNAFAKLIVNHKGNVSKLIFFDNQKPIHIK